MKLGGGTSLVAFLPKSGWRTPTFVCRASCADPTSLDPGNDDFRLKPDSPAVKLGFKPLDVSKAGRQKPLRLSKDLPPVPRAFD